MANYPYKRPGTQLDDFRETIIQFQIAVEQDLRTLQKNSSNELTESEKQIEQGLTNLQKQISKLVTSGDSSPQAAAAQIDAFNKEYGSLKERLDAEQKTFTEQLEETEKARVSLEIANSTNVLNMVNYLGNKQNIHGKVLYFPSKWNGYNYWMGYTPYPNGQTSAENPCISVSNDKENWTNPSGLVNPLDPAPSDGYNSDTHLVYRSDLNRLEIWWRYFRTSSYQVIIYRRTSENGVDWTAKEEIFNFHDTAKEMYSPAVIFEDGKYKIWSCRSQYIEYQESTDASAKKWSPRTQLPIDWDSQNLRPWHLDVEKTDLGYEMIVCAFDKDSGSNNSADLYHVTQKFNGGYTKPKLILSRSKSLNAIDYKSIYRSCFLKIDGVYYVWYSAIDKNNNRWMALSYGTSLFGLNGVKTIPEQTTLRPVYKHIRNLSVLTEYDVSEVDLLLLEGTMTVHSFSGGFVGKKIMVIPYGTPSVITLINGPSLLLGGSSIVLKYENNPAIEMVCTNAAGTEWRIQKPIALDTPVERMLELQNGWTGDLYYSKNGLNQLNVRGTLTAGSVATGTILSTFPAGFRPKNVASVPMYLEALPKSVVTGLHIGASGAFILRPPASDTIKLGDIIHVNSIIQL